MRNYEKSKGFTLVEIMVAMVIGLVIMGGVIQLFTGMNTSSNLQQQTAYLQENGRLAVELLAKDIRNADYWGCADATKIGTIIDATSPFYNPLLHGGPGISGAIAGTDNDGLGGSDTLTVRGIAPQSAISVNVLQPSRTQLAVATVGAFQRGDTVMITNCNGGDIFRITNDPQADSNIQYATVSGLTPSNSLVYTVDGGASDSTVTANFLKHDYAGGGAMVGLPYSSTYSIQAGASGLPALFLTNTNNCPGGCELVEGVQDMQILFGEDTTITADDSDQLFSPNRYVSPGTVGLDISNVISIRISLLLRTEQSVATSAQTLNFGGNSMTFDDGILRRVYTSTVTIRNRMSMER